MAQWWDEWQLRVLVLASLTAQYFLVLSSPARKFRVPPWLRVSCRLAHIGSDTLAIFALATLFNRQKGGPRCSYARGSRDLELLWAPILVMHLGGQVAITTYKIEDNEQWSRHVLTSLSKVTVALYVFYKSWSSDDKRLLAATILLFVLVTIRCFQKALNLKGSSFNALRKASSSEAVSVPYNEYSSSEIDWIEEYVDQGKQIVIDYGGMAMGNIEIDYDPYFPPLHGRETALPISWTYKLFLDSPCTYSSRLSKMSQLWPLGPELTYKNIEDALCAMTSFLYTKDDSSLYFAFQNAPATLFFRRCTQVLAYATLITSICLIHIRSHEEASGEDTRVTFVLLYSTLLLELVYLCAQITFRDRFSDRVLQHSLIGLLAHNKRHSWLRRIAGWFRCKEFADECFWHMDPAYSSKEVTELVRQHVKSWWKKDTVDSKSYRRFNDSRGEWTLEAKGCFQELGWTIQRPFDESIIVWHLATDLCFHHKTTSPHDGQCARYCKEMSNYMMHLLSENPEMLMPGSRKSLLTTAYDELECILKGEKTPRNEKEFTLQVIEKCNVDSIPGSFVGDAYDLAKGLKGHFGDDHGDARMWEVIQGVWVEMLCFSAGRSRGYLHAEALGTGVEYLSYVWLLLAYSGMETFPDKLQRREDLSSRSLKCSAQLRREFIAATTFASGNNIL